MRPLLEMQDVEVAYDGQSVVRGVSFAVEKGTIGCLLGPSGCGKTTLLRAISGFEPVIQGAILLDGQAVSRRGFTMSPESRRIGMVFQDFSLFPHLTAYENVVFGLHDRPRAERRDRGLGLLELVGLGQHAEVYPHQLSGGQQQRIALARALAPNPRLLMLDEPFSSLDVELREGLAREVREILKREGITAILVTHDQSEAFAMADEIGVMDGGVLQQWDTGYRLYHEPANRFVADFVGQGVLVTGELTEAGQVATELGLVQRSPPANSVRNTSVEILIRPDDVVMDPASQVRARVVERLFRGAHFLYTLRLPSGTRVLAVAPSHQAYEPGEDVGLRLDIDHVVTFDRG